jgi:small conductance mechanosensitive channel
LTAAVIIAAVTPAGSGDAAWVRRLRELHLLTPLRIVAIVVVAWVLALVLSQIVTRIVRGMHRAQERVLSRAEAERVEQRRNTLAVVIRSTIGALVWITAVLTILAEVGINLGAFVATATIIGGALAFGAQTLVRDVVAGFFMIAENQYAVGDLVDAGVTVGTVDKVSLRVTRLVDDEGCVWYVPNGQITRLANLSQGRSVAAVDVSVPLTEDLEVVGARLVALARGLDRTPGDSTMERGTPVFVGVEELHADRAVLRMHLPCAPAGQLAVRRAFLLAVAQAERSGTLRDIDATNHDAASLQGAPATPEDLPPPPAG